MIVRCFHAIWMSLQLIGLLITYFLLIVQLTSSYLPTQTESNSTVTAWSYRLNSDTIATWRPTKQQWTIAKD